VLRTQAGSLRVHNLTAISNLQNFDNAETKRKFPIGSFAGELAVQA